MYFTAIDYYFFFFLQLFPSGPFLKHIRTLISGVKKKFQGQQFHRAGTRIYIIIIFPLFHSLDSLFFSLAFSYPSHSLKTTAFNCPHSLVAVTPFFFSFSNTNHKL